MDMTRSRSGRKFGEGDVSRLPKWAQERITHAERMLHLAVERFSELGHVLEPLEDPERGHISYGDWQRKIEIPRGDKVTFHFGDGAEIRFRFNDDETALLAEASSSLELHFPSSNRLDIGLERDRVREKLLEAKASATARQILLRPSEFDGSYRTPKP